MLVFLIQLCQMSPGPQSTLFYSTMLRIQPQILHCWRPMKRTFKSYDESRTGLLNVADFRQVSCVEQLTVRKLQYFNLSFLIENFLENGT